MTIQLKPLHQLDPALVQQNLAELKARVQEDNPHLYLKRGVFADLLVYYNALLGAQRQENINDYLKARSLKQLIEDPEADPDLVDDVLSNFRVERKPGSKASGEVTVVVGADTTVTIAAGSIWTANGKQFTTSQVFTAKIDDEQINSPGDRLLVQTGENQWSFTITVDAVEEGSDYEIKKDTQVLPSVFPSNYLTSFAAGDFTGGASAETNQDLLGRLQQGFACKAPSNRVNMAAMLREIDAFARITHMSIIGMGDREMLRDKHWIFPVAGGGRVDWYFRNRLVKEASLVEKLDDDRGVWQFSLGRNESPAFYEIGDIRPKNAGNVAGGFPVVSDVRSLDLTGTGFIPDLDAEGVVEGVYTRFQTALIQFIDTETDDTGLNLFSKKEYEVETIGLPLIADIQDTVSGREVRSCASDVLVKAPVPCFVQLNFTINKRSGDPDPDLDAVKSAACRVVNGLGFQGKLYASRIQDAVYAHLRDDQSVTAIDMLGRIRYPDGSVRYLRDTEVLSIPDDPEKMVSPRTVQFFVTEADVGISVATTVATNV